MQHFSKKIPLGYSSVLLKSESYNLQHCKINCHKLVFRVFLEQLLHHIIFGGYIFTFHNEIVRSQENKSRAVGEFNVCSWIASEISSCLHFYIMFWTCLAISHFTFHISLEVLYVKLIMVEAVNNDLTSCIRLCNYGLVIEKW